MVDRKARDILAEKFRHLIAGQITNDQFEDGLIRSEDAAVKEVFYCGAWPLYDDLHEHKLTGELAVAKEGKPIAARFIMFLKTDLEYEWPRETGVPGFFWLLLSVCTLGLSRLLPKTGDTSVWPFFRRSDYEAALAKPPYLCGK